MLPLLLQPVRHPHRAVQRRGRREVGVRGARVACLAAKPGEAGVAMGDERLHADLLGEGQRGPVVRAGARDVRGPGARRDLAEQVPSHRLRTPRMLLAGDLEGARRDVVRLGRASGQEVRLAAPSDPNGIVDARLRPGNREALVEEALRLGQASRERVHVPEVAGQE